MPKLCETNLDDENHDQQLEEVIADYIRSCESGDRPDRREIVKCHPELAKELLEFFENRDQFEQLAQPLVPSMSSYDKLVRIRSEQGWVGLRIGSYTLVERLGEGGMGEVWAAEQSVPVKRKVALKLIKRGMNSKDVLARFEQERQTLAIMDHPNIAKVFDAGVVTTSQIESGSPMNGNQVDEPPALRGQPYFVMELVNGLTLTKFCDEARLTLRERMQLFVPICHAVQHAHQKGIVHRDLKPSNILVTMYDGRPVPKVIDFGVAKATGDRLTDESVCTQFGAVVGTLEYMSPEQAGFSGEDIDTRSDIYSLGVILYELLTGLRPIDAKRLRKSALNEIIRIIREEEPPKPSTKLSTDELLPSLAVQRQTEPKKLIALLRGELDWVVMKCLEKHRERRYETANALSRDVHRYLADEVVEARPPTASYQLQKFVRRHKGLVAGAFLAFLSLTVLTQLGLLLWMKAQRDAATNRAAEARISALLPKVELTDEVVQYMQEQVQIREALLEYTLELYEKERRGGEVERLWEVQGSFHTAKARLKWAEGELPECLSEFEAAIGALEKRVDVLKLIFPNDFPNKVLPLEFAVKLSDEKAHLAELKICAESVRKKIAR